MDKEQLQFSMAKVAKNTDLGYLAASEVCFLTYIWIGSVINFEAYFNDNSRKPAS